ncbi:hypothetical protein TWF694_011812 [Orbilia ellipsospora]|uniref:Uncharacterized protein n=1 Tax=Orbilia ellipsospora TaxID=2528407 RepID=A0AAV9X6D1_9PEZI
MQRFLGTERPVKDKYPDSVVNSCAAFDNLADDSPYKSYDEYLCTANKVFPDVEWVRLKIQRFDRPDTHPALTKPFHKYAEVYCIDIEQTDPATDPASQPPQYVTAALPPVTSPKQVERLLQDVDLPATKMRVIIFHHARYFDHELLTNIVHFYDVNPRFIRDHFSQSSKESFPRKDPLLGTFYEKYPKYLPSESSFSPIQLKIPHPKTTPKRTTLIIPNTKLGLKTVLVFVWQVEEQFHMSTINRDLMYPTQRVPRDRMASIKQPQNIMETCLFRLASLTSDELEACISHPILIAHSFIRNYFLKMSNTIDQLDTDVDMYGVMTTNDKNDTWSRSRDRLPFLAFQALNSALSSSVQSIRDHFSAPWVDCNGPHTDVVNFAVEQITKDAQRVQDMMAEVRTKISEFSTYKASQESIREARKSVAQAEGVTHLTRLALVYIPLTYATSLFGINIKEWQDDNVPSGKWFLLASVLCTLFTIGVAVGMVKYRQLKGLTMGFTAWVALAGISLTFNPFKGSDWKKYWHKLRGKRF